MPSSSLNPTYARCWPITATHATRAPKAADSDYPIPQAILYRDYVIDSFNRDKPYDQFLREQIAGDLLPAASEPERWEHTVATGYLAQARRFNVNPLQYMHMTIDDTIDNFGKTVLGLTIACARCHDRRFIQFRIATITRCTESFRAPNTLSPARRRITNRRT
jgi:hypothetical protein